MQNLRHRVIEASRDFQRPGVFIIEAWFWPLPTEDDPHEPLIRQRFEVKDDPAAAFVVFGDTVWQQGRTLYLDVSERAGVHENSPPIALTLVAQPFALPALD